MYVGGRGSSSGERATPSCWRASSEGGRSSNGRRATPHTGQVFASVRSNISRQKGQATRATAGRIPERGRIGGLPPEKPPCLPRHLAAPSAHGSTRKARCSRRRHLAFGPPGLEA